jgi:hypothetical protein
MSAGVAGELGGALDLVGSKSGGSVAQLRPWPVVVAHVRVGAARHLELGASATLPPPFGGAAVFAKVQLTPSWLVDFGMMARLAGSWGMLSMPSEPYCVRDKVLPRYCNLSVVQLQTELIPLIGFNLARDLTLVVSPGARVVLAPETFLGYRLTAGLQWRMTDTIAIHPEVTYMPRATAEEDANRGFYGGIAVLLRGRDGYPKQRDVRSEESP